MSPQWVDADVDGVVCESSIDVGDVEVCIWEDDGWLLTALPFYDRHVLRETGPFNSDNAKREAMLLVYTKAVTMMGEAAAVLWSS